MSMFDAVLHQHMKYGTEIIANPHLAVWKNLPLTGWRKVVQKVFWLNPKLFTCKQERLYGMMLGKIVCHPDNAEILKMTAAQLKGHKGKGRK